MAEFQHTVNVGVDVAVQNAERLSALEKQLRALQSLSKTAQPKPQSQAQQVAADAKLLRAQTQQEAALTEAINQQTQARNKSTIQAQAFITAQNKLSASLVKSEAEFFKAASAADRLAASQLELNRISATKSQTATTKADAGLVTAQTAQAKALAAAQAQQATSQNNLSAATQSAQARAAKAATANAAAQAAGARSSTQFAAAQTRTDAALLRATTAYQKASVAANAFAQAQARAGQKKGIVELLSSPQIREAGESIGQAGFAFNQFVTGPLGALARVSAESALAIDENVNSIRALTGSASAAEGRFQALFALAQKTPGLTTEIATALDSQLKLANVSEGIVDRFLVTVGRLNAIKSIGDPQEFANNLRQLVDQGFEKADLKQVVNRNPIAGELIKAVFGVDNPTNSEAIRSSAARLGITTAERFFDELAKAGENNPKLRNATESLSVQLAKSQDRLQVAIRPLGLVLINAIIPAIQAAVPVVETLAAGFDKLPGPIKAVAISVALLAAGIGPALGLFGGFVQTFQVFQVTKILQLATATTATGTAAAGAAGGLGLFAGSLAAVRTALAATATFLFTTPAGWAVLAAAALAAGVAYLAFNDSQKKVIEQADNLKLGDVTGQLNQVKNLQSQMKEAEGLTGAQSNLNAEQERFNRILGGLSPQQQAVINALGDQKTKVDELTASLQENLATQQSLAQAQQTVLVAAVAARQQEIDKTAEQIKKLNEELALRREVIRSGAQAGQQTIQNTNFGRDRSLVTFQQLIDDQTRLSKARIADGAALDELNKKQAENVQKIKALLPVLGLTEDQFLKQASVTGLSAEQFGSLKKALEAARAASSGTASGADNVSSALAAMQKRAADAQRALETLFSTGDATELRKQVTDRVNQITGQALKAGSGVSGALGEFNKALKDSNDPLANQVKNLQDFEKIQTALNDKVAPKNGGRSTVARDALADIKSRDDLIRAQFEREIALQQDTNQRLQAANQSAFDRQLKSVREFLERKRQLEAASAELDLQAARNAAERANGELLRIQQAQSQTRNKADQQRLAGEEDRVRADIVRAEEGITIAQRRRADVGVQASRDLQKALTEEVEKLREIEVRFLEITDKQSAAARLTVGAESDRQLKSLNLEFAAVTASVEKAQAEGRTADAEALAGQQERLRVAIQQTEEIRRQSLLNVEFGQAQRELTDIDRARSLALDEQQRKLEAVGATDDEVTKQRRAVMKLYQEQIDAVIERLQILQNQGARNPEIEKTIQDLQNRKKNETALSLGQQLSPGIGNVDQIFAERQRQIDAINRSGSLTSLEKDQARKAIIESTNRQLERQLELLKLIFAEKGLPLNEQFKELENRVKESNNQTQSFGTTLRDVAQQGAINSLTGFFNDIASGAKSFKDAALDALGSFIQALQQAVIQAIVLKLVLALFGGGAGAAVPAGAAKGGAVAGLADGGAVKSVRRYAAGGEVQYDPSGFLRGPGGARSDSIMAYFPAANRVARVSNTEYVLDAETTRNLGVPFLDRIRQAKGRVQFGGGFAEGGAVSAAGNSILNVSPSVAGGDTNVALNQTIQLSPVEMTRRALKDRSVVRDILEVIGSERTRVNATLSS